MNFLKTRARQMVRRFYQLSNLEMNLISSRNGFVGRRTDVDSVRRVLKKVHPQTVVDTELIRMGPEGDGGYLIPDDLEGITACFSPGVDKSSYFELDCAERGMKVFLADRSVEMPPQSHERFHFLKKFIGPKNGNGFITMEDWVSSSVSDTCGDLLLQMDIEGAEYESLLTMSDELLRRFRILVIEFHHLEQLWNDYVCKFVSLVFDKLGRYHSCVHAHPNNIAPLFKRNGVTIPPAMELTFLRKDRISVAHPAREFPHPLDTHNTGNPGYPLPGDWYGR